jgi:ATP-dependent Clp protease adapter protein ClpS
MNPSISPAHPPVQAPAGETSQNSGTGTSYRVILYDDDWHPIDEVVSQVQKATGYSVDQVIAIVLQVHHEGRGICFRGECEECHRVVRVLREIKLQCEVDCD